jgi:2-oxoglutarate ferredoxin oxidoreductase subunit beta
MPIDICLEAVVGNCGFVARSFAGDPKQIDALLKAALSHNGTAVLDIISPCVTFNNHPTSTKSYPWGKENEMQLHELSYVPHYEEIQVGEYEPGEVQPVELHDGSYINLKKLERDHDPTNRDRAIQLLQESQEKQLLLTGLIYANKDIPNFFDTHGTVETPLSQLKEEQLRPDKASLDAIMAGMR